MGGKRRPAAARHLHLAAFWGSTGEVLVDSGIDGAGLLPIIPNIVTAPAVLADHHVPVSQGAARVLENTPVIIDPATGNTSAMGTLNGRTIANWTESAAALTDDCVVRGAGGGQGVQTSTCYLLDSGFLGIHASPDVDLHVGKTNGAKEARIEALDASNAILSIKNSLQTWMWTNAGADGHLTLKTGATNPIVTIADDAIQYSMHLGATGLALGKSTAASYALQVYRATGAVVAAVQTGDGSAVSLRLQNTSRAWQFYDDAAGTFAFYDVTAGVYPFNIAGGCFGSSLRINTTEVVVNENHADLDFRVEGDTDSNLIRTDAAADKVGIGVAVPKQKLDVNGNIRILPDTTDVSDPPTDAELDAIFGTPATAGSGTIALIDDANAHAKVWLIAAVGGKWWYSALTEAV